MDKTMRDFAAKNLQAAVKKGDVSEFFTSMSNLVEAIMDCQVKSSERIKQVLDVVSDLQKQFTSCPAKQNDKTDHVKIEALEKRIIQMEEKMLVESTQRATITKMAKTLYAVGGIIGGAGLLKVLELAGNFLN